MVERESPREEAERLLAEAKQGLRDMQDDSEAFKVSLELVGIHLDDAEVALERGDSEASQREVTQALESMHFYIRDALELAPTFTTPKSEATLKAMLDKVNNLRISAWQWGRRLKRERESLGEAMGNPACPAMIYEGITDMATERAIDFCLHKCPYQDRCGPDPKQ